MPSLSTDRVRKARALHAASGAKRVEIVLGAETLQKLRDIMAATGATQSDCIVSAIESDHADCFGGGKK